MGFVEGTCWVDIVAVVVVVLRVLVGGLGLLNLRQLGRRDQRIH